MENSRIGEENAMRKVKITVLRKEFYPELADKYLTDGSATGPCALLEVGDEFIFEGGASMPEGFCPWAWIDIYHNVSSLASGSTYKPWNKKDGQTIVCCSDGIRPVIFEVETVEEKKD